MISLESSPEAFSIAVDGRRILSHSRRLPCVELGRSEGLPKAPRGRGGPRRRRAAALRLKAFKVVESAPDYVAIDFAGKLRMAFRLKEGRLRISFSRCDAETNLFRLRLAAWPGERLYGCGERGRPRSSGLDLKGELVPLWVRDSGELGEDSGWLRSRARAERFPVPAFLSSLGYWCAVDTSAYVRFDFRRKSATLIEAWALPREIVLGFAPDAPSLLSDMSSVLGRQAEPPSWCFDGACVGLEGGQAEVERQVELLLEAGVKLSSIWLKDWCGRRAPATGLPPDWRRDESLYPGLPELAARWRGRGLRLIGSVGPVLPAGGKLYAEASAAGACVKDERGRDRLLGAGASSAALVDLSGEAGSAWMKGLISRELLGSGMAGWEADYGEQLPLDAVLASGEEAARAHNRWPVLWARVNREAIEEAGRSGEAFFFLRSGWLGSTRQARGFCSGERSLGFSRLDGLSSLVPAALSLGLSGIGFWQAEAGGCLEAGKGRRGAALRGRLEAERLWRWMELSAFSPFFRLGVALGPGEGWGPDAESLSLLARMSEVFAALKPYHIAAVAEYEAEGLPPMRHPWLHYGSDPAVQTIAYQYLYGRDLMVAPALGPEASSARARAKRLTELYLPEDDWVHLWTSRSFRGGPVTVESPPGCPAVFYRAASGFAPLFDTLRRTVRRQS
ncbi:MAG TPA: glycoside hydrolase family 31 protein [Spirochaetia bacterium]|nr:glycoside hydrolase family 31 protein [Spirochaetia bacterium]